MRLHPGLQKNLWKHSSFPLFKLNEKRFIKFKRNNENKLKNAFYIIVMPNVLHILEPCLKLLPKKLNVCLVLNKTKKWEKKYLKENYPNYPIFSLVNLPITKTRHGTILTILLRNNDFNFGIIDHDCYILDKTVFNQLKLNNREVLAYTFYKKNKKAKLIFPKTNLLFFNVNLIKKIMEKYHITAVQYIKIPSDLKEKLLKINIGKHNFPIEYQKLFDTLLLICAMAHYEKKIFKKLKTKKNGILHIGHTSYGVTNHPFPSYIHLKILENTKNKLFKNKYLLLFSKYKNSDDALKHISGSFITFKQFKEGKIILKKIFKSNLKHKEIKNRK